MRINASRILILISVVIFALAAFGVAFSTVNILAIGLAVFAASFLVE